MTLLLKPIKDPARFQWHEVHPERRLNAAKRVKKVDHYYLSIDAITQPVKVREGESRYGGRSSEEDRNYLLSFDEGG
jgi:hypothetical protein